MSAIADRLTRTVLARDVGRDHEALHRPDRGMSEFSDDPSMDVRRAIAQHNTGHPDAIAEYADDLDRTRQ
jgi:hypothetical protein